MKKVFSNSSLKVSKSSIFDLKFINLYFCTKLSDQTNSRMFKNFVKMNLMNLKCFKYFKSAVQNTQIKHFGSKFKNLYFWTKLCSQTNSKVFVSNMNSFFEIPVHNTTIDDFKYDNSFLKLQHPNILICKPAKLCNQIKSWLQISNVIINF